MLWTLLSLWISSPALAALEEEWPGGGMADGSQLIRYTPTFCLAVKKDPRILCETSKNVCSGYLLPLLSGGHMA